FILEKLLFPQEGDGPLLFWAKEILVALLILSVFWMLAQLVVLFLNKWGKRLAAFTNSDLDDRVLQRIIPHLSRLLSMLGIYLAIRSLPLHEKIFVVFTGVLFIALVVIVFNLMLGLLTPPVGILLYIGMLICAQAFQATPRDHAPDFATRHELVLKNLASGTEFGLKLKVRDEDGNETEETFQKFKTATDENSPKIEQVRTDSALTQSDKVQAIISWKTDENSDTSIIYKEGKAGKENEIKVSDVMTTSHIAVITTFKPGTVYYFNVKSIDVAGNEAKSNDFALLTPKRKENIIQIIVNNFQDIFGWAQR
ncbi:MAG: MscS Mechanosensitive ion channel, partial [Candidatus Moranbacteria bacterium GW2011_GWE2_47_10]